MERLFKLVYRFHFLILFLIYEFISLVIVVSNDNDKWAKVLNSSLTISSTIQKHLNIYSKYFSLYRENEMLAQQNSEFYNKLKYSYAKNFITAIDVSDTLYSVQYQYISAKVVNNSIVRLANYITINVGKKHGIEPDMAVISTNGIVGVVRDVTNNFSSVISVLNTKFGVSAKFKKNDYFGSIKWDGANYRVVSLNEIPSHIDIAIGDTIVTSGYSSIFPKNITIGTVESFKQQKGESFLDIRVKLSNDFKQLSNVYVIRNFMQNEQKELEAKAVD